MSYTYNLRRSSANQQYFWNLEAANHEGVAWSGETYVAKTDCTGGLGLFRANAPAAPVNDLTAAGARPRVGTHEFEVYKDAAGKFRWRFQASNNQIVAASGEGYESKQGCLNGITLAKRNADAPVVDHTAAPIQTS